jgi:hypothetical protein
MRAGAALTEPPTTAVSWLFGERPTGSSFLGLGVLTHHATLAAGSLGDVSQQVITDRAAEQLAHSYVQPIGYDFQVK